MVTLLINTKLIMKPSITITMFLIQRNSAGPENPCDKNLSTDFDMVSFAPDLSAWSPTKPFGQHSFWQRKQKFFVQKTHISLGKSEKLFVVLSFVIYKDVLWFFLVYVLFCIISLIFSKTQSCGYDFESCRRWRSRCFAVSLGTTVWWVDHWGELLYWRKLSRKHEN